MGIYYPKNSHIWLYPFNFFQTFWADKVKVILKEYLLAMTSILFLQHFVKTPHCICSAIVGCYAKEMVAMEILWVFTNSVKYILLAKGCALLILLKNIYSRWLMFKYFVQNQQFICSVVDGCYAKKAGARKIWVFLAQLNALLFAKGCAILFF